LPEGRKGPRNNTFFVVVGVVVCCCLGSYKISVISVYNHKGLGAPQMCNVLLLLFVENWD